MSNNQEVRERQEQISEQVGEKVDIPRRLLKRESSAEQVGEILAHVQAKHEPDNERIDHYQVVLRDWDVPVVRVWCKSNGFDHTNNRMAETSTLVHGRKKRFYVDVRPF